MKNKLFLTDQINDFLDHLEIEKDCSQLTIRNYKHYLTRFAEWFEHTVHNKSITELNLDLVKKYRIYLSRYTNDRGETLASSTQSYHIIALRSFLKWLTKNDFEVLAPEKIDLPKAKSKSLKFLKQEQIERLLDAPNIKHEAGLRDKAILEVLFSTGLRVSELANLNRDQIDFKSKEFSVIGKGRKARVVFLSDRSADWLQQYFEQRADDWIPAFIRYARGKYPEREDGADMRLTPRSIQRLVKKYRKKAQISVDITPHGLRHTFATDLLFHGAGLREVQEMLGHKNISTTQIYTHVTNPQLKKVHQKFHSANKGKSSNET